MTKAVGNFLKDRVLKALIENKFESLENSLSFSSMMHGMLILLLPVFSGKAAFGEIDAFESSLGILLLSSGLLLLTASCVNNDKARRVGALLQFMGWTALTVMISFSPLFTVVTPFVYISMTLVYGFIYLHLSVSSDLVGGRSNGG